MNQKEVVLDKVENVFKNLQIAYNEWILPIYDVYKDITSKMDEKEVKNAILEIFKFIIDLVKSYKSSTGQFQELISILSRRGWYFDKNISMDFLAPCLKAIESKNWQEIEEFFCNHYQSQLDHIQQELITLSPKRSKIFEEAFEAHRAEKYFLSIPILLMQVDGICKEKFDTYFFMRSKGKPQTAGTIGLKEIEAIEKAILSPLYEQIPIRESEKERKNSNNTDPLNRHTIIHGESVDYGTRINSYKTISLLNFISQAMKVLE